MAKKTIRHALFTYSTPEGGQAIALRGQTIDLAAADVERGEQAGAFTAGGAPQPIGDLAPYPLDGGPAEQDAWVTSGTVEEITDAVAARPEIAASVVEAEERRGASARKTLLAALGATAAQGAAATVAPAPEPTPEPANDAETPRVTSGAPPEPVVDRKPPAPHRRS